MAKDCKIIFSNNVKVGVEDNQGNPDPLFNEILSNPHVASFEEALEIYKNKFSDKIPLPRVADQLPLTLQVLQRPEFVKMQGKIVNPITVLNSLNQTGIKQIEKDLIKKVIEDNYQGQKNISYDELEATVRANIMPLERIFTSSYADYGMGNLGDGNYGNANTISFNAPIEHGVTGHFSGDFKASGRQNIKYQAKQLNDNTWVAVEEGYESQANDNNIYQYVGTAGTKEAVDEWIDNYNNTDTEKWFVFDEKSDPFGEIPIKIFNSEVEAKEYLESDKNYAYAKSSGKSQGLKVVNKGMFGHIRVWQDGEVFTVAELQSDFFQKNNSRKDFLQKDEKYKEQQGKIREKNREIERKESEIGVEKYKVSKIDWKNYVNDIINSGNVSLIRISVLIAEIIIITIIAKNVKIRCFVKKK